MKKNIGIVLIVLVIFVGGFFFGRWTEGKRQAALCRVAIMESEKKKDDYWNSALREVGERYDKMIELDERRYDRLKRSCDNGG